MAQFPWYENSLSNVLCGFHCQNIFLFLYVAFYFQCVIQSYLQWLRDSDCNPICTFCNETLSSRECCRLTCYHVYHWACLDSYCRSLPESKNPASYECPTCNTRIIPQPNLVSIVADVLREKLNGVNWARAAQGLPLVIIIIFYHFIIWMTSWKVNFLLLIYFL